MNNRREAPDSVSERSAEYYQGIIDATRYALDKAGSEGNAKALERLLDNAEDHRRAWFADHMVLH